MTPLLFVLASTLLPAPPQAVPRDVPVPLRVTAVSNRVPATPDYRLEVDEGHKLIKLKSNVSGRVVWAFRGKFWRQSWSKDRTALAVDVIGRRGDWQMLIWRPGDRLHVVNLPQSTLGYNMGTLWSPDGRSLLVRPGDSAASDLAPDGAGTVWMMRLGNRRSLSFKPLIAKSVWGVGWQDAHTVAFKPLDNATHNPLDSVFLKRVD